ncbi:unnamed protein product [Vitrella brassicaformis CCMP3155]|uniref:RIIa domain-containing protein n=1 Tax=Vitrella brassicaformis (strain CCMP3155) TaxID=1169540 RepID=A0A0G4EYU3_VITBC|nr:unnamed protein product [Vitrella brassicaformis CCMP3155]|mmetsp:Transcript_44120/g.109971  ORF Transcript_44120/g.109971 Transcript_44120/m.109971 type:complete len:124 (-) Transcript_44120:1885-2256(-)|eukprot:CEM04237.1 unnamed protein product [Vitrella brassicaformis CCMP3155]
MTDSSSAAAAPALKQVAEADDLFDSEGRPKDPEPMERLELRTVELSEEHWGYVEKHPELRQLLTDFLASVLLHTPEDVFAFAREYFSVFVPSDEHEQPPQVADQGEQDEEPTADGTEGAAVSS